MDIASLVALALAAGVGVPLLIWGLLKNRQELARIAHERDSYTTPIKKMWCGQEIDYTRRQTEQCPHYFNGGYRDGVFYPAGYYSSDFWRAWEWELGIDWESAEGKTSHLGGER